MREHMGLYRGKRIDNGEWVEGSLLYDREQNEAFIAESFEDRAANIREVDPDTVGECTGLRDKNGKLIFEGDVIKIEHEDYAFDGMSLDYRSEQGVVTYDSWGLVGIVVDKFRGENVWSDFFHVCGLTDRIANWTFEILGNVHDNPELLKGGEGDGS